MNKKTLLLLILGSLVLVLVFFWRTAQAPEIINGTELELDIPLEIPSHEEAELIGFRFMQDVILVSPPNPDSAAVGRVYQALSRSARSSVEETSVSRDVAQFVGIQDVPDNGVSVEDLQIVDETRATLILGLNYTDTRTIRVLNMVVEGAEWKVDSVDTLDDYPPEEVLQIPTAPAEPTVPVVQGVCQVTGCSSQLCIDASMGDIATTCEWREEYACYRTAACERQSNGQCGWTETDELQACLSSSISAQ